MSKLSELLDNVYSHSPRIVQDAMVSAQGWLNSRQRFGRDYHEELRILTECRSARREDLLAIQAARLQVFLSSVCESSPFYRAHYRSLGPYILDEFPLLSKGELRGNLSAIMSSRRPRRLSWVQTSGTTGSPMRVGFTVSDLQKRYAAIGRQLGEMGVSFSDRKARFSGRTIVRRGDISRGVARSNWPNRERIYSTYHITAEHVAAYVSDMREFSPVWAVGYPSAFVALATLAGPGDLSSVGLRAIMTTAETLTDESRELIQEAFSCKVYNQYAASEGVPFITQCREGRMHANLETGVFEALPLDSIQASTGYELVVTAFNTNAFPLVRYRTGDVVSGLTWADCACGYAGPVVGSIQGRLDDMIVSPERGLVGRLDPVFKSCRSTIIESQIEQVSLNGILLRYVPGAGFKDEHLLPVLKELELRLGRMDVECLRVAAIARGASGKFRSVVGLKK